MSPIPTTAVRDSRRWHLSQATRLEIIERYRTGAGLKKLEQEYGISDSSVWYLLKRHDIPRRPRGRRSISCRRYTLDETAFNAPTPAALYWAGLLMADGCVTQERYSKRIYLTLNRRDTDHLEAYRRFLATDLPIYNAKDGCSRVVISSIRIAENLARFGIVPRKSLIAKALGSAAQSSDFWRGLVDGDGHLRIRHDGYAAFDLVGSWMILEQFTAFLKDNGIGCHVALRSHGVGRVGRFTTNGRWAKEIVRLLYANAAIALPRKIAAAGKVMAL